jgi:predicted RNase H-like HicB family nuclease
MAHGDSQDDALANVHDAVQLWIDTSREFGDPVPDAGFPPGAA